MDQKKNTYLVGIACILMLLTAVFTARMPLKVTTTSKLMIFKVMEGAATQTDIQIRTFTGKELSPNENSTIEILEGMYPEGASIKTELQNHSTSKGFKKRLILSIRGPKVFTISKAKTLRFEIRYGFARSEEYTVRFEPIPKPRSITLKAHPICKTGSPVLYWFTINTRENTFPYRNAIKVDVIKSTVEEKNIIVGIKKVRDPTITILRDGQITFRIFFEAKDGSRVYSNPETIKFSKKFKRKTIFRGPTIYVK